MARKKADPRIRESRKLLARAHGQKVAHWDTLRELELNLTDMFGQDIAVESDEIIDGCSLEDVLDALGLTLEDVKPEHPADSATGATFDLVKGTVEYER